MSNLFERMQQSRNSKRLTNVGMQGMIPMFVSGGSGDHKCRDCSMFLPGAKGLAGRCTIVQGTIWADGTCMYQAPGENAKGEEDIHATRLSYEQAQYAVHELGPVNCSTCVFLDGPEKFCKLWQGQVLPTDCCISHDSPKYKAPGE